MAATAAQAHASSSNKVPELGWQFGRYAGSDGTAVHRHSKADRSGSASAVQQTLNPPQSSRRASQEPSVGRCSASAD